MNAIPKRCLIDLGNSRLKYALLDVHGGRGEVVAISHEQPGAVASLLQKVALEPIASEIWLASVASTERTTALTQALEGAGFRLHRIHSQAQCGKLRIAYPEPARLGVDRFLALLAASERVDGPWLIVSAGSALTVDLLGVDGVHLGGMIAPMPIQMRAVLAGNFPQLDLAEGRAVDFADNTADAIASGTTAAALGLVEHALRRARKRLATTPSLLLCGGNAGLLADIDHPKIVTLPALVLDGMACFVRSREP